MTEVRKEKVISHISCDHHAAQLIYDENIELRGRLAKLLLQNLQDGLHHSGCIP